MAVVFDTSTMNVVVDTGGARDMVFTKPANLASGERCLVIIAVDSGATNADIAWTVPGGWDQIITEDTSGGSTAYPLIAMWEIIAGGSEPADYTFSYAADVGTVNNAIGVIIRVTGDNATFADAAYTKNEQTGTLNPVAPTIETVTSGAALLAIAASNDGRFLTSEDTGYPPDFTGIIARVASASGSSPTLALAYKEQASPGASGTATFTGLQSTTAHPHRSIMFAIRPASGGASGIPRFQAARMLSWNN